MKPAGLIFAILLASASMPRQLVAVDREAPDLTQPRSSSFEPGRKAVQAKDFKAAIGHLTKAAGETPNDADVHNLLGYSYRKLNQFEKAMEHYRLALNIDPNHRGAHEYIGELYLEMGQLAKAEQQLQILYNACPWFGRCEEYEELKEAIEKYKRKNKARG